MVRMERDAWLLLHAVSPAAADAVIAEKRNDLDDPEFRAIYLEHDAAFDWSPDDERLLRLADRARQWFAQRAAGREDGRESAHAPTIQLMDSLAGASSPAWDRLREIRRSP